MRFRGFRSLPDLTLELSTLLIFNQSLITARSDLLKFALEPSAFDLALVPSCLTKPLLPFPLSISLMILLL